MIGNYLGTISLCGMVAEMVAILLFEICDFKLNNKSMNEHDQKSLFGSTFEKLGQDRRVQVLYAYSIINDEIKKSFDLIRNKRKKYLHLWSQDHRTLSKDAIEVYHATVSIVVRAIGQDIKEGKIALNPSLVKYLEKRGIVEQSEGLNKEKSTNKSVKQSSE
ncbi:MAG: hypothetical protein ACE5KZ_15235 [Candidatus Scalinduaceae bacterium]